MKIKIGITGQGGFVGKHLFNTLGLFSEEFEIIPYVKEIFDDKQKLENFVLKCDVIVHLAALNRHNYPQVIYDTNIGLVHKLINALNSTDNKPHIIFSSSSQEDKDNLYGKSKKEGREILQKWAEDHNGRVTSMVIPNVFGPFGNPNYNSFIATFSHKLTHGIIPTIDIDGLVKLIYIDKLIGTIIEEIRRGYHSDLLIIPHSDEYKVSQILEMLNCYKNEYFEQGIIPVLKNTFEVNLFNTFRSYIDIADHFPVKYKLNQDPRGTFVEVVRLNIGGQVSFSTTVPGITRGNHFHTRKIERFAVIKGKALIQLRRVGTSEILEFFLDGSEPCFVDMPVWYTHNITNIGNEDLYTNFWINEFYDNNNPDTYFEVV